MGGRIHGAKAWTEASDRALRAAVDGTEPAPTGEEFCRTIGAKVGVTSGAARERMRRIGLKPKRLDRRDRPARVYECGRCGGLGHNERTCR